MLLISALAAQMASVPNQAAVGPDSDVNPVAVDDEKCREACTQITVSIAPSTSSMKKTSRDQRASKINTSSTSNLSASSTSVWDDPHSNVQRSPPVKEELKN